MQDNGRHRPASPRGPLSQLFRFVFKDGGKNIFLILAALAASSFGILSSLSGAACGGGADRAGGRITGRGQRVWIDVATFAEGIGGWSFSVGELLRLARSVDGAVLVEPCMSGGRLGSCSHHAVPLSQIFDLSEVMRPSGGSHPLLLPYADYERRPRAKLGCSEIRHTICMSVGLKGRCSAGVPDLRKISAAKLRRDVLDPNGPPVVLRLEDYWKGGRVNELAGLLRKRIHAPPGPLPFHPNHVEMIEDVLRRSNVTGDDFSVVHWRAEREGMDFAKCANAVLDVKRALVENEAAGHQFVLMTSLNKDPGMMWEGSRTIAGRNNTAPQALDFLLREGGFLKVDDLLKRDNPVQDPGMLAIYDLILAIKSKGFATCARDWGFGCNIASRTLCRRCNHVGKFGKLALSLRQGRPEGSSWGCWPRSEKVWHNDLHHDAIMSEQNYQKCRKERRSATAIPVECFELASDFVESSLLWALVGGREGKLDVNAQLKILDKAEECASVQQADGIPDEDVASFRQTAVDLYTLMGTLEYKRRGVSRAARFFKQVLKIDRKNSVARRYLFRLSKLRGGKRHTKNPS